MQAPGAVVDLLDHVAADQPTVLRLAKVPEAWPGFRPLNLHESKTPEAENPAGVHAGVDCDGWPS